jgi:hypothetical protein
MVSAICTIFSDPKQRAKIIGYYLDHVIISENPDDCWGWIGATSEGYGVIHMRPHGNIRAHKISYAVEHGAEISGEQNVLHSCDNPPCTNPKHLFHGTKKDNTADMWKKGRGVVPDTRGEKNGRARLSDRQVMEIFLSKENAESLSKKYGIDNTRIWKIKSGKAWVSITKILSDS